MRVIAGTARGVPLAAPTDRATRPITDRVKETLFGILGERVVDARVLDLYAGSGAIGIEALSRGAAPQRSSSTGRAALAALRREPRADPAGRGLQTVRPATWSASWRRLRRPSHGTWSFLDPPYEERAILAPLERVAPHAGHPAARSSSSTSGAPRCRTVEGLRPLARATVRRDRAHLPRRRQEGR